jgi:DNA modification methylase
MELNKTYNIKCEVGLLGVPDQFANACVTSPPYFEANKRYVDLDEKIRYNELGMFA